MNYILLPANGCQNIQIHFHFRCYAIYLCEICYDWWCIVIVFNLIGDCIFLQSEPQKSIVCHQTFIQGLGMKLT